MIKKSELQIKKKNTLHTIAAGKILMYHNRWLNCRRRRRRGHGVLQI